MFFTMVITQRFLSRTFEYYTLQLFDIGPQSNLVPVLGVGLLIFTYIVNISGNKFIQTFTTGISLLNIAGLVVFSLVALWATNISVKGVFRGPIPDQLAPSFMAAAVLSLMSFIGFMTITT